jgi:hypothetical protein
MSESDLDILLVVPFDHIPSGILDPGLRRGPGAHIQVPIMKAAALLEGALGCPVPEWPELERSAASRFSGRAAGETAHPHRSLTAVTLATHLERAGLSWRIYDPRPWPLWKWRRELGALRQRPLCVGICSTFVINRTYLHMFGRMIRRLFPTSKLLLGGYYYSTNALDFLRFDADVLCVGEGEVRLPQIVQAIKEDAPLDAIPGLYLRTGAETRFTGPVEPLDLHELAPVDLTLARRIDPPVDIDRDVLEMSVETQRGCVFKCQFCTYRTLASPNLLPAPLAVDRILNVETLAKSHFFLVDATGTFPRDRWKEVLHGLIDKGFSRTGMCYARVSDIDDETAALMRQAGMHMCFIGQETGDDRLLKRMRKGTRLEQVKPAIDAMGAHGISAIMSFIHGFPGEDAESLEATRKLLVGVNDGFERSPVVYFYDLHAFMPQDFAAVTQDASFERETEDVFGHHQMSIERAASALLETFVRTSRVPHAPLSSWLLVPSMESTMPWVLSELLASSFRDDWFHWAKAIERGVALFIEADLTGRRPDRAELRRLREQILAPSGAAPRFACAFGAGRWLASRVIDQVGREWSAEAEKGMGFFTRFAVAYFQLRSTGVRAALARRRRLAAQASDPSEQLARMLVSEAVERGRRAKLKIAGC